MTTMDLAIEKEQLREALKHISGYVDCEKIIVRQIRKQVEKGFADAVIESNLKSLASHLEATIEACEDANVQMNYRYVIGFVNTLLRAPSWKNWMQTIEV
jgi:Ni,Fe-hydrogenase III component G